MKPFKPPPAAAKLTGAYPPPDDVKALVHERNDSSNASFVRMWLSEGIPYAFRSQPFVYQSSREWISTRLGIYPHEVTIVGSARLGYSLKPSPGFRAAFRPESDLDYVIVSESLFQRSASVSLKFVSDFETGETVPFTTGQKRWWPEDVDYIKRNIPRGFVNGGMVPNLEKYEGMRQIEQTFSVLSERLKRTDGFPAFSKATYRIYKDYSSFIAQASLNLKDALLNSI